MKLTCECGRVDFLPYIQSKIGVECHECGGRIEPGTRDRVKVTNCRMEDHSGPPYKGEAVEWPIRLTLRDTKVTADEGQCIFTTATGHGYERQEYVRADLAEGLLEKLGEARGRWRVKPLKWSEPRSPGAGGVGCSYHHVVSETPFGDILLTWKGWKDDDYPSIDAPVDWSRTPEGKDWGATLEEAKAEAERAWEARVMSSLEVAEPDGWERRTYRVEWVTEVYGWDQYEARGSEVYYERAWPTEAEARADLERVSVPHNYVKGRRTALASIVPHDYHACGVRRREVLLKET